MWPAEYACHEWADDPTKAAMRALGDDGRVRSREMGSMTRAQFKTLAIRLYGPGYGWMEKTRVRLGLDRAGMRRMLDRRRMPLWAEERLRDMLLAAGKSADV